MMKSGKRRFAKPNATGRNDCERYVNLGYPMLQSAAWRSSSGAAVKVWLELRTRFNGSNNGRLILSLDHASRLLGLGKATVQRAFVELAEKGFIVMRKRGHWYGRQATEWAVTDKHVDGSLPTVAWRHWRPPGTGKQSVPRRTEKTEIGSEADRSKAATGPLQNRAPEIWSATEPVSADSGALIGSEAGR